MQGDRPSVDAQLLRGSVASAQGNHEAAIAAYSAATAMQPGNLQLLFYSGNGKRPGPNGSRMRRSTWLNC